MSTLPLLMSLADELDNINTRTFPDDFGLGFYPHRHYNRNPSLQLSLPSDTEWLEQRRQSRTTRKYYSTESPEISASPTTNTNTNYYRNVNDSPINNCSEQNENKKQNYYDDDDDDNNEYVRNNSKYDSRNFPSTVKIAIPAIDSQQRIIDIKETSEPNTNNKFSAKETKKLNNSKKNGKHFAGTSIAADESCIAVRKDGVKNKKNAIRSK